MKAVRIRQIDRLIRSLKADDYEVIPRLRSETKTLLIVIKLKEGDEEALRAQNKIGGD